MRSDMATLGTPTLDELDTLSDEELHERDFLAARASSVPETRLEELLALQRLVRLGLSRRSAKALLERGVTSAAP